MKHFENKINTRVEAKLLVFAFVFCIFSACTQKESVKVGIDAGTGFPVVEINNPFGQKVEISPISPTIGSIGFEKNGETVWVKGKPAKTGNTYVWQTMPEEEVMMEITEANGDIDIKLSLTSPKQGAIPTKWHINVAASQDEYFTGLFERVVDGKQSQSWKDSIQTAMDLRGENVEMHLKPTVSAYAPFYVSSKNYGFFAKGTWPGVFDFCKQEPGTLQIAFEGPDLSFKIYLGSLLEITQKHALETGPSVVPPEWALGPWRWRDDHSNKKEYYDGTTKKSPFNTDLVEDVLMMQAFDIPCTAHWIDRPWGKGQRGFDDYEFDTDRIPDPEGMIKWLNNKGMELMMWIGPFVMGKMADYAEEKGYHLQSKPWYNSRQILMDFTNPEACKWWGENGPGKLARMGIKGYKLDRADGEKLMDSLHYKTFIGTTYRENFNDYPRQYVKAANDAIKEVLGDDFILFPRAQYTGSAKYGGMWAGDTNGKPEGLRSAIIAMQRCAIMGYPVWGSDIGGYWGKYSNETCMRWMGFGCFSPLMETGPTNNKGLWNNPTEPAYDTELIATWRLYSKTRMKLVPYVKKLAQEARATGMPIARPLFLIYPDQKQAWEDWQTYLLGPDILVSAIWQSGKQKHTLYLPGGEQWIDAWDTEKTHQGGQTIQVDAPKHKIPLYIRKGSGIDLGNLNQLYEESLKIASNKPNLAELEKAEGW